MSRRKVICCAIVLALACTPGARGAGTTAAQTPVDELLAIDRAFSAASIRMDLVAGLSDMFAHDVMMPLPGGRFANGAAEAAAALRANPENVGARTDWIPVKAGVSADGQQGFTLGYMTIYRADSTRTPLKYLAYWVKRPHGWRVVAYKRSRRGPGAIDTTLMSPSVPPKWLTATRDSAVLAGFHRSLGDAERAFSDRAQVVGLGAAFTEYGRADAINMGGPAEPKFVIGSPAIGRAVGAGTPVTSSPVSWGADKVIVASSGDLGVTFGVIRPNAPAEGAAASGFAFFTIWRRDATTDPWRYIAE